MTAPTAPRAITLAQLCDLAGLTDDAKGELRPDHGPREFITALIAAELYPDAISVLAHALPKRECVWWGWICAKRVTADPSPAVAAALTATERWIAQPSDANRRATMQASEAATLETPAGCAALAAFLTSGSLAPENAPPVAPPEFASSQAVAGAVIMSAVIADPQKAAEKFRAFIQQALDVAARINLWGTAPAA